MHGEGGKTVRLRAEAADDVAQAATILRGGGTVAFPTETVYGLGANALDPGAVAKIFAAKQRPGWDPLIVHVSDEAMLSRVAVVEGAVVERVRRLQEAFWPGPLTMLLPRTATIPDAVTAGRGLVGVRMPRHETALELIRRAGVPVAAPSANRFGRTSPTTAAHVLEDLDGRIDAVLDGGATTVGVESTVLDVSVSPMTVYRPGAVTPEMIRGVAGEVEIYTAAEVRDGLIPESLPSPGLGVRHYAPRARLVLVKDRAELRAEVERFRAVVRVGVMLPEGWDAGEATAIYRWGAWESSEELARRVFAGLRDLDLKAVDVIVCPLPVLGGMANAVRDRLEKAARAN